MDIETIAQVAHETNRAYCQTLGDTSQPAWDDAPPWQRTSAINGVNFHLERLAKGTLPSPSRSHEAWLEEKRLAGWRYGPTKDPERKTHPCFMPYALLPVDQRLKDYLFAAVVKAFFEGSKE